MNINIVRKSINKRFEKYFDYLEDYQKQIYYEFIEYFYIQKNMIQESLSYYDLAFQQKDNADTKAMLY